MIEQENRLKGIQEAMKKADLPEKNLQLVQTNYSIENGSKAFEKIMGAERETNRRDWR